MKVCSKSLITVFFLLIITFITSDAFAISNGFIPAANRSDMVFDDARGVLYITNGNSVLRYKIATDSFLSPFTFSLANLSGIDLSPDGNTLAIADRSITGIHQVDLQTDTIKPDILFTPSAYEGGSFTVAYGNDGSLLVSTQFNGSGWVPLRRVDPGTGAVTIIKNSIRQDAMLSASADGKCIAYEESNISSGPVNIYDVASKSVIKTVGTDTYTYEVSSNRDCTQFAVPTSGGTLIYDNNLSKLGTIGVYAGGQPKGVAYNPVSDVVYFAWSGSAEVRAYDTGNYAQLASFDVGYTFQNSGNYAFNQGRLKTSRDGSLLFATVGGGVRYLHTALNPSANDQALFSNSSAARAITLSGSSPKQLPLTYTILTQPTHGTIQGSVPTITYTPEAAFSGQDSFTFKVSDGTLESAAATVSITVDKEPPAITSFTMPELSSTLTVAVSSFTASDNTGVNGCCLTETLNPAACLWSVAPPVSYHFNGIGPHTLHAYVRDNAGNISTPASATVNIPEIVPKITTFSIPSTYGYRDLTIPVTFAASDDLGVSGYCLTESADPASCSWNSWAPTSYTLASVGPHTLYAFARNNTGRISAAATASTTVVGQVNFIPAPGRIDMVYDSIRDVVYITSGTSVLRYKLGTQTFLSPYTFGLGNLSGIDLSPDGNLLAIADRNISGVHLVDLQTDTVKPDAMFSRSSGEGGTYSVAFGNDGTLLVTTTYNGSGWVPLRRIDPATGTVTTIKSSISQDAMLSASADGKCIGFVEGNISSGPLSVYDVATKSITKTVATNWFTYEVGSNRDCSQFAVPVYGGTFLYDNALTKLGTIGVYAGGQPIGVAYNPVSDVVYFAWTGSKEVRAYDTTNFAQLGSYDVGYTFQNNGNYAYNQGRLKTSRDGSKFFVTVPDGVRYQRLSSSAPVADDQAITSYSGTSLPVTLTANSPQQASLTYSVSTPPAHGSLQGIAPNLIYTPDPGFAGVDIITFKANDGTQDSNVATLAISVKPVPTSVTIDEPALAGQLTLRWTNPVDPDFRHIHIYRSTVAGLLGGLVAEVDGNAFTDNGLSSQTGYYYTIRAVYYSGQESSNTAQVFGKTLDATPPVTLATPAAGAYPSPRGVMLSCNDGSGSACASTYYCLGSGCAPTIRYSGETIAITSSTDLRYFSIDQSGNVEFEKTASYLIQPRFITASPASLNFGAEFLYYPAGRNVTISNLGTLPLVVSASQVVGPDSTQFSIATGGPAPCTSLTPTLGAGAACTITVTFTPDASGLKQAYLVINSNADNSPFIAITISGMGVPPVYLTTNITGNGTINNIAQPPAFTCDDPTCIAPFAAGTALVLKATPASLYRFSGWSGDSCAGMGDCLLTLISNASVSASFTPLPLIQIEGSATSYLTFLAALTDAPDNATFKSRNATISENILLDRLQEPVT